LIYFVTGATGFLGRSIVKRLLTEGHTVISYARSEHGHEKLERLCHGTHQGKLVSTLGDVRDAAAVHRAMRGANYVIHCAAQKIVPWAEKWPEEAVKTNVLGTINVSKAAEEYGIHALLISTDKACLPCNTYAASKFLAERSWIGPACRFGNLWGSTGSVIYYLLDQSESGIFKITDKRMTRFSLGVDAAAAFTLKALYTGRIGEVWIPKMPSYRLPDLCEAVNPDNRIVETGIRHGEKLHEDLISMHECFRTQVHDDRFVITDRVVDDAIPWNVRSDSSEEWMTVDELREGIKWLTTSSTAQEVTGKSWQASAKP
jgi:UDP-N-acetylglucosamine 4,6-dehydratase